MFDYHSRDRDHVATPPSKEPRSSEGGRLPGHLNHQQHPVGKVPGNQPFFIGVAGGTASGKTTVCDHIMQRLHDQCVVMLSQDSFYRGLTQAELDNVKGMQPSREHRDQFCLLHTLSLAGPSTRPPASLQRQA